MTAATTSAAARPSSANLSPTSIRVLLSITWPQLMMMLFQMLIGFTDVFVAGRIAGDVQAALGIITECMFVFMVLGMAVANAGVATISQSMGARLRKRAQRYVGLLFFLGMAMCLVIVIATLLWREPFLDLLRVPAQIRPITSYFLTIFSFMLPAQYLLVISNAVFRAHKLLLIPLACNMVICLLNAVADFGFGLGYWGLPNYGYQGVAWATFISITAGMAFNMYFIFRKKLFTHYSIPVWRWVKRGTPYLVKVATPAAALQFMWCIGYLLLFTLVGNLPHDAVNSLAGMTAGMRVESLLFLPGMAFSMTASILVGQSLGAGKPIEAKHIGRKLLLVGICCMSSVAVILWLLIDPICAWLTPDPAVHAHARAYLRFNILSTPFTMTSMTLTGVMSGAGATLYGFIANGAGFWLVRLPLAYLLGHILWQTSSGVFFSMLVGQLAQSSLLLYIFERKDWPRFSMIKRKVKE